VATKKRNVKNLCIRGNQKKSEALPSIKNFVPSMLSGKLKNEVLRSKTQLLSNSAT
jgi:hypothetical protein